MNPVRNENAAASRASSSRVDGEYWMSPSLEELRKFSPTELSKVKDFKVGVPGVGSVSFLEPVDLTTVPSLASICGNIVQFSHKICVVYPDEDNKPARGEGLNVPALISLERCWPVNRSTREPIIVAKGSAEFVNHVKRLKRQSETEFLDFTADNGTWTFKVRHFSKYGLSDDEEDDQEHSAQAEAGHRSFSKTSIVAVAGVSTATVIAAAAAYRAFGSSHNEHTPSPRHSDAMDMDQDESYESETSFRRSSFARLSKSSDPQRHNVMRASLFGDSPSSQDRQMKRGSVWSNVSSDSLEQAESKAEHADGLVAEVSMA
jgi:nuclear pore complex protein Nup98-Nup96